MQLPTRPGVVFYGTGDGTGTALKDHRGADINPETLTSANWIASSEFAIGRAQGALATLAAKLAPGKSLKLRFETKYVDDQNGATWSWAAIPSMRLDTVTTPEQIEHTILPADLVGPDLGAGPTLHDVAFRIAQAKLSGLCRVMVTCGAAPAASDYAIVAVVG
ncbi:MAG TPA: hypothetical protein VE987_14355 [Polyangiaceae bacterium]|nr:hypothetical protein [Polyangiaceae bacterium]